MTDKPVNFGQPGDPNQFGQILNTKNDQSSGVGKTPLESNADHENDDTDVSARAHHHTLGTGRTQAAAGNHIHDGITSPLLGQLQMSPSGNGTVPALVLTGAKGGNVALTNLIAMLKNVINFTDNTT